MNQTIFVTAELAMHPDHPRDDVIDAVEQFCRDMESEAGCLQARATYDDNAPHRVILWERYASRAAIDAHFAMPHTQAFIASGVTALVQAFETMERVS
ncbi:putative quinol monooxygenase [Enterovibrio coralii]|uniref:Antibiotic biosynthesis monooxygenase n=1 Tax=Enterovibrio coralii TaxID=294935 RepID=A0A135IAN7_9GAMM|nr:antibiotic biosynthesis monooxygenase [Enterovibrio coralii]KXF82468.1 antibiotic biosynthesis monooxygenase [Enterovibrio coralii]